MSLRKSTTRKALIARILFPVLLSVILFVFLIFAVLLPDQKKLIMDRKKEMIREVTASAWSVLAQYQSEEDSGRLKREEAHEVALDRIRKMRYGPEGKDYFWIIDMQPAMKMHPYRPELEDQDLSHFKEKGGKNPFIESVNVVKVAGEGYVEYHWQWKDDPARVTPKLSYVRGFAPWGWIIGTGVYYDDVQKEMSALTTHLLLWTTAILLLIVSLLVYGVHHSLRLERKRQQAEEELINSERKYRLLVESVTEGLVILLDGRFWYANQVILQRLGYNATEFFDLSAQDIFADPDSILPQLNAMLEATEEVQAQFETRLTGRNNEVIDVVISANRIPLLEKNALNLTVQDISQQKKTAAELVASREKYRSLADQVGMIMFRLEVNKNYAVVDGNWHFAHMLGLDHVGNLLSRHFTDFFVDVTDRQKLHQELSERGSIKNRHIRLHHGSGKIVTWSINAVLVTENDGSVFCDGLAEDITSHKEAQRRREMLQESANYSVLFDTRPLHYLARNPLILPMNSTAAEVAHRLQKHNEEIAFISSEGGKVIGMIDTKVLSYYLPQRLATSIPCYQIMKAPVPALREECLLFEALKFSRVHELNHLPLKNSEGNVTAVVSIVDLLENLGLLPALLREFQEAQTMDQLREAHANVPSFIQILWESGSHLHYFTNCITSLTDAFTQKIIELAMEKLGPAPVPFVFLALGSEGRSERTLIGTQQNILLYADPPSHLLESVMEYFLNLGEIIADELGHAGYSIDDTCANAKNPMSVSRWRSQLSSLLINNVLPNGLGGLPFFDFRPLTGQTDIAAEMRQHVYSTLKEQGHFFAHLASGLLDYLPPPGLSGKLTDAIQPNKQYKFLLKNALDCFVDFARLYAWFNNVGTTNTLQRFALLKEAGAITQQVHDELSESYRFLMYLQLKLQMTNLQATQTITNPILLNTLTQMEISQLRQALAQIQFCQNKVRFDFLKQNFNNKTN